MEKTSSLQLTASSHEKWLLGRSKFPCDIWPIFRCKLASSFREGISHIIDFLM